jgi:hypothetical protein
MIVSPYVFCKIPWKFLIGDSAFRCEFSFKEIPESLQTIDMISFSIAVLFFTMSNKTINVHS